MNRIHLGIGARSLLLAAVLAVLLGAIVLMGAAQGSDAVIDPPWVNADGSNKLQPDGQPFTTYWFGPDGGVIGASHSLVCVKCKTDDHIAIDWSRVEDDYVDYRLPVGTLLRLPVSEPPPDVGSPPTLRELVRIEFIGFVDEHGNQISPSMTHQSVALELPDGALVVVKSGTVLVTSR